MAEETGSAGEKTVKVLVFKGGEDEFRMWNLKFLARARIKGYRKTLVGDAEIPKSDEELDLTDAEGKKKSAIRKSNEMAYNDLLLSMEEEVCFGIVAEAVTEDLPEGDSSLAWKNLLSKYMPKTNANKIQLKREFNNSRMEDENKDPEVWLTELERLRQRLKGVKVEISDDDLVLHVLGNLPENYETVVAIAENQMETGTDGLTLENLKTMLRSKFQKLKIGGGGKGVGKYEETALCYSCNTTAL